MASVYKVYGYRWVVLAVTMFANATLQILWISYAPIASSAAAWYGVSEMQVGLFAMSFMIAFLPLSIPASWLIDRFGFATAIGVGALLAGGFGLVRGLAGHNYAIAIVATFGMAIVQPLFLNSFTKLPAEWFPASERATGVGLVTLASIVGTAVGLVVTPILLPSSRVDKVQLLWGGLALVAGIVFVAFARNRPPSPPDEEAGKERALVLEGIRHALGIPAFWIVLGINFLGMGVFNGLTTWIEDIAKPRGVGGEAAGILGAMMLLGGILGAVVIPALSDRSGRRKPWIMLGLFATIPFVLGMAFGRGFVILATEAFFLGFFLIAMGPVSMQYAAEIAHPSPEGATNGLVTMAGQASVVLVWAMEALNPKGSDFTLPLLACALFVSLSALLSLGLKEGRKETSAFAARDEEGSLGRG